MTETANQTPPRSGLASEEADARPSRLGAQLTGASPAIGFLVLFVALFAVFAALKPTVFPTSGTINSILSTSVIALLLSLGLVFVLIVRDFDLSIASNAALAGSTAVMLMSKFHEPTAIAVVAALLVGMAAGAFNGTLVAYFRVNALITTLATASVFIGIQEWITDSAAVSQGITPGYTTITSQKWGPVPADVVLTLLLALVVTMVLRYTVFGRHAYATGSNQPAARLAGVRTRAVRFWSYVILGLFAGAAGVCLTSLGGSTPQGGSTNSYLLPAYAAAFLGAITIGRGKFTAWSAVLGVLFVNMLQTGLVIIDAPLFTTDLLTGAVLLIAVLISRATPSSISLQ